ncbi:hypothetical protein AAFF_G00313680 [Aldrovandia affinis]|uniref:TFIIS N-terminal domain-containing protein n=1 Tax=Aldrovandia affinis TaxID=143900 RepID=A0AAD7R7I1_9TELE|nr:hypothetical protein AAFF_G00313680 [Aldrovandia affinis]
MLAGYIAIEKRDRIIPGFVLRSDDSSKIGRRGLSTKSHYTRDAEERYCKMAVGSVDPQEVLKGVETLLGKEGELRSLEGVARVFSLMKASHKMVSRCMYLNILLHTKSHDILNRFIRVGGYKLLNAWLTYSKATTNTPLLQLILLILQKLPLTVDHLKQNNTAKLVKQLSRSAETEELRKLASVLVEGWMAIIRSQSASAAGTSPADRKRKKEESRPRGGVLEQKEVGKVVEEEKKKEKPKAYAPSHAKSRSTGLEMDTPTPLPAKKPPVTPQIGDKYNIKPAVLKRPSLMPFDAPPVEKKYKPLNTTPNSTKEIKVKIIPAQPMECTGFLEALNSAPVSGKIKKKKKPLSPTSNKVCPFEGKAPAYPSPTQGKTPSPEACSTPPHDPPELEQPGTPVPCEDSEPMDTDEKPSALSEPRGEDEVLTKKGKRKKSVHWPEEEQLKQIFFFHLDETERVNVNKVKDFGEAARRELMMDRQTFEMSRRLSHDAMEERVSWSAPQLITPACTLISPGANSTERLAQRDREMGILQEIFLSKDSVPDSPHEPEPESYEPAPPRLIPLDEDSASVDDGFLEPMDTSGPVPAPTGPTQAKLPPVLANLMGSLGNSSRSPQNLPPMGTPSSSNSAPSVNVQELLTSITGGQSTQSAEDLIKQPDFHKIKALLGSLQQNPPQGPPPGPPTGLLGHAPGMNVPMNGGFPPNKPPQAGPPYPHPHPPPPPPHSHAPPFPSGGDMSSRPVCRHFMMKGNFWLKIRNNGRPNTMSAYMFSERVGVTPGDGGVVREGGAGGP